MLSLAEVSTGFHAAVAVLRGRPEALKGLDMTFEGFWRSFMAPFLVLPIYALHVMAERRLILEALPEDAVIAEGLFVASRLVGFLVDVAAFPLLLAALARPLGIVGAYVPLIVAFNWTAPLVALPLALPAILLGFGAIGTGGATVLLLAALALAITWRFRAAMAALGGPTGLAAGMVALDFLLSIVLGEVVSRAAGI